jgi:DNA-directed RNA polymerase subunit RPC12/RpoP
VGKPEYECRKCGAVFSLEQFSRNRFCPRCSMHLWPKFVESSGFGGHSTSITPVKLTRDQVNVATLFAEFERLENFNCGEGIRFKDVDEWIVARKEAYLDFKERFSQDRLVSWEELEKDFREFLYFRNNKSWTTLYRTGLQALQDLERLWKLIVVLQDENVEVMTRIRKGLQGEYYCRGIGQNILTALLHTFHPDSYGVMNSRTANTLRVLRRTPAHTTDVWHRYMCVNQELLLLRDELKTELTTIDSFMWYVSKRIEL